MCLNKKNEKKNFEKKGKKIEIFLPPRPYKQMHFFLDGGSMCPLGRHLPRHFALAASPSPHRRFKTQYFFRAFFQVVTNCSRLVM